MEIPKIYDHKNFEEKIYRLWEESKLFSPEKLPGKRRETFTIVMPPPNANGPLHIGHAVFISLQDLMIRYQRMKGKKALWIPGFDHAGFETQVVFDKKLEKEGKSRFEFSKKELFEKILAFSKENITLMREQLKKLGASCDWSREAFTLDKKSVDFVLKVFRKLKKDGFLYKGERIVNWCPKHQTALSDLEVKYIERTDPLYFIKYGPLVVATTRPETKFGDVALAVHPKDKRYKKYIGKEILIEDLLGKKKMKVIADFRVDPNFGTGVLKITPAHDFLDFEIAQTHNLKAIEVIDEDGKLNENAGPFQGMEVLKAREKVVKALKEKGLLVSIDENYKHKIAVCYKCFTQIEPILLKDQYFLKMKERPKGKNFSLKELAEKAVLEGKVEFTPKRFKEIFLEWLDQIKDWNISRQIVWGIKIPDKSLKREDVFDTWFSSSLWPITVLKMKKGDFKKFYPTDVMETGYDILFFWVARMIMMGMYLTGKPPFKRVFLHGLVRDKKGQKMSKSKGNVIDPLGIASLYGVDALRMALIFGTSPGSDLVLYEEKFKSFRNFANKIWNASRFVLMNLKDFQPQKIILDKNSQEILKELKSHCQKVTQLMDSFQFHLAAQEIYDYFWHRFCDQIIEKEKERLKSDDEKERQKSQYLLFEILKTNLKLLHPFMPFITEAIYQMLPFKEKKFLMIESWPV